mgnify:CR=1 FL=1
MTTDELKDLIYEAQEHLQQTIGLLETYVRETHDRNAEAYLVDHLKILASRGHGFLSRDLNLDDLIERLENVEIERDQ